LVAGTAGKIAFEMMDHSQILTNLFVGSFPKGEADVAQLKAAGITAVLNLQTQEDFDFHDVDWPHLQAVYFAHGLQVRRVPIQDFDEGSLRENLPQAVRVLAALLGAGHTVYVHCNVGMNRSPSTVISCLHWSLGWNLDEAEWHVRTCRSCAPAMEVIRLASRDRQRSPG